MAKDDRMKKLMDALQEVNEIKKKEIQEGGKELTEDEFLDEVTELIQKKVIKNPEKPMLGVYLPVEVRDRFRTKCKEEGLKQSEVMTAFIEGWYAGEYVIERDTKAWELREALIKFAKDKGYKVSEVIDVVIEYVINGQLELEQTDE